MEGAGASACYWGGDKACRTLACLAAFLSCPGVRLAVGEEAYTPKNIKTHLGVISHFHRLRLKKFKLTPQMCFLFFLTSLISFFELNFGWLGFFENVLIFF